MANGSGLKERVRTIDALPRETLPPLGRAALAREHFSQENPPAA